MFNNFYVLGNSLSDGGAYNSIVQVLLDLENGKNKFKYKFGGNFKNEKSQFYSYSNGMTAVEWINIYLGFSSPMKPSGYLMINEYNLNGRNFAVGGARAYRDISVTLNEANLIDKMLKADIITQTQSLLEQKNITKNDLILFEIGGNDLLDSIKIFLNTKNINDAYEILNKAVINIKKSLDMILIKGSKVLYTTTSDIQYIPLLQGSELDENGNLNAISKLIISNPKIQDLIYKITEYFYIKIIEVIDDLKITYKDSINTFDLFKNFKTILDEYCYQYKLKFNKDVNFKNNYGLDKIEYDKNKKTYYNKNLTLEKHIINHNIDDFFYIDNVHPTRYVHQFVGKKIYNKICEYWLSTNDMIDLEIDLI
ncbi:SGNH/GDSL hydrolase family protein [Spiroplasma turonicum]|uniref:Lipolytic enzyme, GDSL family n=1 Tax=Spiroplasma turonicum TaxID=216946 RepID=A0A0K1P718_9MOLU|nr:SGNH/GDSL hydrolase family protein [Spiroplasma turonicum]AKU79682.1 hypothetical protein STURON_00436 [Spiroplasma turonicum]ALX70702.1 lipolytic enzyme [Spiroplasma turonicum]